jgi:DNA-binding CsgD family transcriptional regulator
MPPASRPSPIVGRAGELALLQDNLEEASGGERRVALISGEAGIGKTRLLGEFAERARQEDWLVLSGHAYDSEGMPPYLPFIEALQGQIRATSPDVLREQLGTGAADVSLLIPELRRRLPALPESIPISAGEERYRLFEAVCDFLDAIARAASAGLLICLDDLHWADESSLLLLEHLARRPPQAPMLVLATYRATGLDVSRPLARLLEELARRPQVQRLDLRHLEKPEVGALLAALGRREPPSSLVEAIYRETEGNPFFVHEVFQYLEGEGRLFDADGNWLAELQMGEMEVPQGVRLVIGRRLERLSDPCRRVVAIAAVLGRVFDYELLRDVAQIDEESLLEALEEAQRAQLLVCDPDGKISFVHELIRQTLLSEPTHLRRRRLHLRAAESIERVYVSDLGPHLAELAVHYRAAGADADAEKAIDYARRAAEAATSVLAWKEAVRHFETCLALTQETGADRGERMTSLLLALGIAQRQAGLLAEWQATLLKCAALCRENGDAIGLARTVSELLHAPGYAPASSSDAETVGSLAREALDGLGDSEPRLRAGLLLSHSAAAFAAPRSLGSPIPDYEELTRPALAEASGLATANGFRDVKAGILNVQQHVAYAGLRFEEARAVQAVAFELLEALGDFEEAAHQLDDVAHTLLEEGRLAEAERALQRCLSYTREHHVPVYESSAHTLLAGLCLLRADWPGFWAMTREVAVIYNRNIVSAAIEMQEGPEVALKTMQGPGLPSLRAHAMYSGALARLYLGAGERERALGYFQTWKETVQYAMLAGGMRQGSFGLLAVAMADLGDDETVAAAYAEVCAWPSSRCSAYAGRGLDALRGDYALRLGLMEEAEAWFETGLEWSRSERCPADEGRCLQGLAEAALRTGARRRALQLFAEAEASFQTCGAEFLRQQVAARRAEIEEAPASPKPVYPDGLSMRQMQVLRLIAEGKTTREMADELVLSVRTVERHAADVYTKIGARNRAEATAYALNRIAAS